VEGFTPDWRAFRIPPADAAAMNPAQLQVLEAGRQALADVRALPRDRTGIWLGATGLGWQPDTGLRVRLDELEAAVRAAAEGSGGAGRAVAEALAEARAGLEARLRPASEEPVVNSAASIAAGRVAMLLDLRGPHCAVDAGFASGLAALELAVRALRDHTVDCALLGGASELLSPAELAAMSRMGVLSAAGARPFDADAAGTAPGEGAVLLAAKRLEDALRDGDRVHAVVLGVGAASEGGGGSLLAARPGALALAIRRAHSEAGSEPASVGFVECHATGTLQGDAAEVRALQETYGAAGSRVALGSAKPLVGHLRGASGAVGLLRAVLALERGTVPPQAGFARAHPDLGLDGSLFVPTGATPLRPAAGAPAARAGVSAVSLGGLAWHAVVEAHAPAAPRRAAVTAPGARPAPAPVAVVGLGGVFPGAPDVPAFWRALLEGHDAVREVPPDRWDAARYCDRDPTRLERSYTRLGCFVDAPPSAPAWRIPPAARDAVDPAHLLALAAAEEAIRDAGVERGSWDRERTGVFLGFMACQGRKLLAEVRFHFARLAAELEGALAGRGVAPDAARALLAAAARRIEGGLPALSEDALPGWLGSVAAARIARRFDLRGPQLAVESACASTLAALMAGVQALRDGTCDTVLVGGVWADMQPEFYVGSCRFQALSATGSTPFDARANGFVPGEGAGVLVLRRLADAERDGQRIHAVVRAVAGSSDGKGKSVLAPSADGESLAMRRALDEAGVDPASVDYVECHGTGTALGDKTEIEACLRAYGRGRARPLRVGSVKSNFGHLLAGAAAPALLKAVLAVREGTLPGSLHLERANPAIDFSAGPVEVVAGAQPWTGPGGGPRRAGVSGFGLGGTNLHAIVEEYRPRPRAVTAPGAGAREAPRRAVLPIAAAGGRDAAECLERLGAIAAKVRDASGPDYLEALRAGQEDAAGAPYRVAVVAPDGAALGAKLGLLARGLSGGIDPRVLPRQGVHAAAPAQAGLVAAMFPGQGPQYPNMLRDALAAFPSLGRTLDAADRAYLALCGRPLRTAFFTDDPDAHAQDDEDAHCAVFAVNVALHELLRRHGLAPRAVMGQSAGELAALVGAGAMSLEDGLAVVRERTLSVLAVATDDPGRMVALACDAPRAERLLAGVPGYAAIAADNGPGACIVSGDRRAVPELLRRAAGEGIEANVLAVSHGYHSELIRGAQPRYLRFLEGIPFRAPEVEVISTVTGRSLAGVPPAALPRHLASQFVEPVRLAPAIEALHERGVRLFVECGPKWPLSTFAAQILGERPHLAQATIHPKVGEVEQLHRALAALFVHGAVTLTPREEEADMAESHGARTPEISLARARSDGNGPAVPQAMVALLRSVRDLIDAYLRDAGSAVAGLDASPTFVRAEPPPAPPRQEAPAAPARAEAPPVPPRHEPPPASARAEPPPVPVRPEPVEGGTVGGAASAEERVRRALVEEYVRRTGYPEEMLDPALDLEAELGIDTVKQVAALAAVRERLGLAPDPAFKLRDASTIAKATVWLVGRMGAGAASPARPVAPRPSPHGPETPSASARAEPPPTPVRPEPVEGRRVAGARPTLDAAREQVRKAIVEELVRRTGYPEEMLDPDLDLEAELGIDTVKQVAVLAAARQRFGLPPDPAFRLRDANTLRKAVEALARRVAGDDPAPRTPPEGPRPPPGGGGLPRATPERAAPPSNGASPPAGTRASGAGTRRLLDALLAAVAQEPIRTVEGIALRVSGEEAPAREPFVDVTPAPESPGTLRLRAVQGTDVAEATVRTGPPPAAAPAPAEIVRAIAPERRDRAATGAELREALAPILGDADGLVEWARSDGFMVAAGGARMPEGDEGRRIAALLACASEVASFAWVGLTGAPHAVCGVERATFDAVPEAGAELGVHAKMVAPEGGLWRADVTIVCGTARVAEIRGLQGSPVARAAAAGPIEEAANRAWQRFCRRMRGGRAGEDVA
jgi:acyl transferase domain-containing protein